MTFQWPLALVALVAVPVVAALYVRRDRGRLSFARRFGNPALLPNLVVGPPRWRRHLPFAVLLAALAAMVVGVARPHATVSVPREEATVLLAIDVSRSMTATDVKPSRLGAARYAAEAFLRKVPKKFRVGVVAFGTRAFVALPPTEDRALAVRALRSLRPSEGTALGDAVSLAVRLAKRERLSDGTLPPTAVLLLSDGAQQGGHVKPASAAQQARAARIPVSTISLGTASGTVTVTLTGGYNAIVRVPPNPQALQALAQATGGQSFTVRNDARLREVYERLGSRLGKRNENRELTDVFAGGSALLLLAGGALSVGWFRRVP
jgi:Ca-activated chloride channel family protein